MSMLICIILNADDANNARVYEKRTNNKDT